MTKIASWKASPKWPDFFIASPNRIFHCYSHDIPTVFHHDTIWYPYIFQLSIYFFLFIYTLVMVIVMMSYTIYPYITIYHIPKRYFNWNFPQFPRLNVPRAVTRRSLQPRSGTGRLPDPLQRLRLVRRWGGPLFPMISPMIFLRFSLWFPYDFPEKPSWMALRFQDESSSGDEGSTKARKKAEIHQL